MSLQSSAASLRLVLTREPLLERLFFASLELIVLAVAIAAIAGDLEHVVHGRVDPLLLQLLSALG